MNYLKFQLKKHKGLTLIETLVALVIFTISIAAVVGFAFYIYRSYNYTFSQARAINEARKGIQTMVKELREAKMGDDGSYILEKAEDYEIVFYSDIDKDNKTERIRYFIYDSKSQSKNCVSYFSGGSCSVDFLNFSSSVDSAKVNVCVEGDLNGLNEYVDIYADGEYLGRICQTGCGQCQGVWQGCTDFDVTSLASDGSISFTADSSSQVGSFCDWQEENHSIKAKFDFSWTEKSTGKEVSLKKGVIEPTGSPISYPQDQEKIYTISRYIRNTLPVFRYFDGEGNELSSPVRLEDTKLVKIHLIVNVDPNRPPDDFDLESSVQIRNLKTNL